LAKKKLKTKRGLSVQSGKVQSLQGANRVAANEEGIKEVLKRRD
jgi:hypothetical protein